MTNKSDKRDIGAGRSARRQHYSGEGDLGGYDAACVLTPVGDAGEWRVSAFTYNGHAVPGWAGRISVRLMPEISFNDLGTTRAYATTARLYAPGDAEDPECTLTECHQGACAAAIDLLVEFHLALDISKYQPAPQEA